MKKLVIGILAHVDAGKTTLSESMLYLSGKTRSLGRVDSGDAYLDIHEIERARGITVFSKQAVLEVSDTQIFLLDTPGHVDFSTEMERTLGVLDYAILVVSGADGVQGHTKTLWELLSTYRIPVFIFVNKMDQRGTNKEKILNELKKQLNDGCIEFGQAKTDYFYDQLAMCDESLMEAYLETGHIKILQVKKAIRERKVFPCFFGAALKQQGVETFMQDIVKYADIPSYPKEFGARVFKIGRDEQENRLTYMKITGGTLKVKDVPNSEIPEDKVNQIRIYSGSKFEAANEVTAGTVCAVTGLSMSKAGDGFGIEEGANAPILEPVLTYQILLPEGCDPRVMLPKLRQLEEEDPELNIIWDERLQEIRVQIMGEVQIEILQSVIKSRFGIDVSFGSGKIVYKETIANVVEGVGHFEPLRHYAEVHLLMEPRERGSGLVFAVDCSDDVLGRNWKNTVLYHLKGKVHKGVLTGSPITDIKITLVSGKAHNKHTVGGDFREAAYRAVRQGLKEAESILLEPYYTFRLEVPEKMLGRAMTDIERMYGTCEISGIEFDEAILTGSAPVVNMKNYQRDVTAYTKGCGKLFCSFKGYEPCHNPKEIIESINYDSERDVENPTGSIFCANGAGFLVDWNDVKTHMHVESYLKERENTLDEAAVINTSFKEEKWLEPEEVDRIINQTYFANKGKKTAWRKKKAIRVSYHKPPSFVRKQKEFRKEYLLVDGYNIIFAWADLKEAAEDNMDSARTKLLDYLSKYRGIRKNRIIVVFDAYRVEGHKEEIIEYDNIHMVYTGEGQTADHFIEKFAHDYQNKYDITVATSDGLQQGIIRGLGCTVLSARELRKEIDREHEKVMQSYSVKEAENRNYLKDSLPDKTKIKMEKLVEGESLESLHKQA